MNPSPSNQSSESPPTDAPHLRLYSGDAHEQLTAQADLETLLDAWNTATLRLEHTHATLHAEVARLSDELECKNRELARKNRLADLGQMASHVAHEVKNNLVPVTLNLSLLRRRLADDSVALDTLSQVEAGFQSLDATVNDLLSFTAHRQPQPSSFIVGSLVEEVIESLAPQLEAQAVDVDIDIPPNTVLQGDREMVRRALLNLVLNSLDAMPDGGELVITTFENSAALEIEVADSGPGVPEQFRRKLFEPFFSTKSSGTGLGLAIVEHVVQAHGGTVSVSNCPEGGAAFTLRFPLINRGTLGAAA
ncbi:sensor histidine kinase [Aeoliella mucimassa]|uniref:histidine kinase n=1 Tax=Aeoliella mucimassa TaxID=2527972 RepID=A0A518AKV3_9BACT|nr:HAMP domain-containing sensor histidine kinase [Aeoliella mucimassa]QDU55326.1 Globin-coupled histidine kinase [Aeoliella mucimassa]